MKDQDKRRKPATKKAAIKKENQDFPNIPAATENVKSGKQMNKEIKQTSKLHKDGKTDNTDQTK